MHAYLRVCMHIFMHRTNATRLLRLKDVVDDPYILNVWSQYGAFASEDLCCQVRAPKLCMPCSHKTADVLLFLHLIQVVPFGAETRKFHFCLEDGIAYLNHGSYGAALRCSLEESARYTARLEAQVMLI